MFQFDRSLFACFRTRSSPGSIKSSKKGTPSQSPLLKYFKSKEKTEQMIIVRLNYDSLV